MIAWLCWIVIRGDRTVALKWRIIAFAAAIAVFVSTLTLRQHVILDIPGGIAVAEIAWLICKPEAISGLYARLADAIDRRLPRRKE